MMLRLQIVLFLTVFSCLGAGCQKRHQPRKASESISNEDLIKMNQSIVGKEANTIKKYIKDSALVMTQTKTGMWYRVDKTGSGARARVGQTVSVKYKIGLLDGTKCYNSDSLGLKVFRLGQGGVESGLEEGLLLLQKGGRATFIMPAHLAHGIAGDNDKIPLHSILLYEAEIVDLK